MRWRYQEFEVFEKGRIMDVRVETSDGLCEVR